MPARSDAARRNVLRIVAVYAVFAGLWILLSDKAVGFLFEDPDLMVNASLFKGWVFVAVTSFLLYKMLRSFSKRHVDALEANIHSLKLLESISESSDDAIFAKDQEGRYLLFNRAASRFVGKSATEVLGRDDYALFPPEQAELLASFGRRVMGEDRSITEEEVLDTPEGRKVFLATKGPLHDAEGNVAGVYGVSRDITERKHVEEALREKAALHEQLNALAVSVPGAILSFRLNPDGSACVPFSTPAIEDVCGLSSATLVSGIPSWAEYVHPEDLTRVREGLEESARRMSPWHEQFRFRNPRSGERWLESWSIPYLDGEVILWHGFVMDITERKHVEQALQESEQRFHDIVSASADWTWEVDARARYTYASDSVEELLGYTPQEIIGKTPFDLMPPEEAERLATAFAAIVSERRPFRDLDNVNVHKDGSLHHVWTNGMPILGARGELLGYRGLDRDVTLLKEAESALIKLSNDLASTLRAIPDLLFELDEEGRYLKAEATAHNLRALPPGQLLGHTVHEMLAPEAARTVMDALAAASTHGVDYGRTILLPLPGGPRSFELSTARKERIPGETQRFVMLSRDITERAEAEQRLRDSEKRFRTLFNSAAVGIFVHDKETGRIINANERAMQMFGCKSSHEFEAKTFSTPPYSREDAVAFIRKAAEEGPQRFEWRSRRSDGSEFWQDIQLEAISLDGVERVLAVTHDITGRKNTEEELKERYAELERFNRAAVGRELTMVELKKQINDLSTELGREPPFSLEFANRV